MLKENIIITDIGSTTTKALYLKKINHNYQLVDYASSFTTVEKPYEDVKIGIYHSIKCLEAKVSCKILKGESDERNIQFLKEFSYLTCSSAGGGLQILVMGLTLSDSASSAERAAYGVGGVILDTLAIDDKKTSIEKLKILNNAHPDIILFCGGIDGGALFSVYRQAEILKLAHIRQKFTENSNVPLIYAGNTDARGFIKTIFQERFDIHFVDNLRPKRTEENLEPSKEKIHDLFLNNVMEQAPGYSQVKRLTETEIIPTPTGVLNAMKILGKKYNTIIAFDIGGATTDVYSNIFGDFHRSVSANFGMSYSIGNIISKSNYNTDFYPYVKFLFKHNSNQDQAHIDDIEEYLLNYAGNKVLHPTFNPHQEIDVFIEHIIAIKGIRLSIEQHHRMHFQTKHIGFLDYLKDLSHRDPFKETFYYPKFHPQNLFRRSDIEIAIGAGGVISHCSIKQAIFILIESIKPEGIIELWRDKMFISPHLGVLSQIDKSIAEDIIYNSCIEVLAIYIRPIIIKPKKNETLLTLHINNKEVLIKNHELYYHIDQQINRIEIECSKNCQLSKRELILEKNVALIIDTRDFHQPDSEMIILDQLKPYQEDLISQFPNLSSFPHQILSYNDHFEHYQVKEYELRYRLPFKGDIFVKPYDKVHPDTLLFENQFDPPKLYIILISSVLQKTFSEEEIRAGLHISINDQVSIGDKLFSGNGNQELSIIINHVYSNVRGIVENIDFITGTIIIREIQDYPLKPVEVNVAKGLGVRAGSIKKYLNKREGDFVYADETIASIFPIKNFRSPYTGTIQEINSSKGTVKICYDNQPYRLYALCYGKIKSIAENNEILININAINVKGKIGFGNSKGGRLAIYESDPIKQGDIVYAPNYLNLEDLNLFSEKEINGLICNTISYQTLRNFIGKDIGVALTGNEALPFPIIILKGFSEKDINTVDHVFNENRNKYVLIQPYTQIRAGVKRPEIYIMDR